MTWPAVATFPGGDANTSDPLTQSDPWRGWASQRSHIVHSGMSPKLERERETLDSFLADIGGASLPPIPIPTPVSPNDSASILQVVL